jgi:alkanesulfonate monooxygenase SsuD/methylene tetrahydromethanopterin reductase-like flavin-dependent oxidoreductase (luciferase family)
VKVGVGLGSQLGLTFDDLVSLAGPATELGFDSIWTPKRTLPDSFHLCVRWSERSALIKPGGMDVGIGVVPAPQMWHPASLASQAATAAMFSGGRFILGIGTGGYGPTFWDSVGLPNRPIGVMRDYVGALRATFRGGPVDYTGRTLSLHNFALEKAPPPVPIYLGALGPQMLRLAGECADGVLMNWASPETIAQSARWLEEGIARARRDRADVTLSMYLRCAIDDDIDAARRTIATEILEKIAPTGRRDVDGMHGYRGQFVRLGFESDVVKLEQRLAGGASMQDLLDDVPSAMCAAAGYFGTAESAAARVADLTRGLDAVVIRVIPVNRNKHVAIDTMKALAPDRIRAAAAAGG